MANDNDDLMDIEKTVAQTVSGRKGYTLAAGQSLGQYRIARPLGRGGMGEVYEAEHTTLGRRYALKLLPADFDRSPDALERFRREARVMANLEHPNIIRVDEFGETDGRYWLRMELAVGLNPSEVRGRIADAGGSEDGRIVTLADLADACGGKVPQETLLPILRQVLQALDFAHGHGAVHRDLKPGNILLTKNTKGSGEEHSVFSVPSVVNTCTAKISDFGLVKLVGEEWLQSMVKLSVQRSMSMGDVRTVGGGSEGSSTHSMLGTYEYMSPEQKRGEEADARSDLYAAGLMCYRLLTGRANVLKLPSRIDPDLAPAWDDFVERSLEEEPNERLQSAKEGLRLLEGVERWLEGVRQKERQEKERAAQAQEEQRKRDAERIALEQARSEAERKRIEDARRAEAKRVLKKAEIEKAAGETQIWELGDGVRLEMVWCPPGTFLMGSPEDESGRRDDETQHRVTLTKGFWMGKHEVTQAQWESVTRSNPSNFKNAGRNAPVERVSWEDCREFVRKLNARVPGGGFRLPTEAEWEYACRAGTTTALYTGPLTILGLRNGPELDDIAWYGGNSGVTYDGGYDSGGWKEKQYDHKTAGTHPAGQKKSNAWGLHDMFGNVWEWCHDWHGDYPTGSVTDPTGPDSGSDRVLRGGSWDDFARSCRSAFRCWFDPGSRSGNVGLRLARDPR